MIVLRPLSQWVLPQLSMLLPLNHMNYKVLGQNSEDFTPCSVGHVMYNDESPAGQVEFYRAHAKGVLGFGAAQPLPTTELRAGSSCGADPRSAPEMGGQAGASRQLGGSWAAFRRQLRFSWATCWLYSRRASAPVSEPLQVSAFRRRCMFRGPLGGGPRSWSGC